jgi:nicotinamide/nicotinate riboside kinase
MAQEPPKATIIGISGPSSSGKTTLARLLQRIFCGVNLTPNASTNTSLNTFIIHEDDFYFPDDQYDKYPLPYSLSHLSNPIKSNPILIPPQPTNQQTNPSRIPTVTLPSGKQIQDWDTAAAIDIPFLSKALTYVRENGTLPPRLRSKEDQNDEGESGVPDGIVSELRDVVERSLSSSCSSMGKTVAFLEGFLLFSPPDGSMGEIKEEQHILRPVHDTINLHLFLPAPYELVKARREGRSGYVTIGPAPDVSTTTTTADTNTTDTKAANETADIDLEAEDDRPPQNFWTDPPGYVDDIVWPRYVEDHSWLLIADEKGKESRSGGKSESGKVDDLADLVTRVGDGRRVRRDVGVEVAPGCGEEGMEIVLRWAVKLILEYLAKVEEGV